MSRLPRHAARVKPPLRGRAATKQYRGKFASISSVRRPLSPYGSTPLPPRRGPLCPPPVEVLPPRDKKDVVSPETQPPEQNLGDSPDKEQVTFYKRWIQLLRDLDKPWQWLAILALVFGSLLLLKRLL